MNMVSDALAETRLVVCAYDGSVNGHWIARYAIRLATAAPTAALRFVHVNDEHMSSRLFTRKLEHMLAECARAGLAPDVHEVRAGAEVPGALIDDLPPGPQTLLVCGARAQANHRRFLVGTVAEQLLRRAPCRVLALRVMMPELLGAPRKILLPVAGNPGEARAVAPFLKRLRPGLQELHLLRVMVERKRTARLSTHEVLERLRGHGQAAIAHFETELRASLPVDGLHLDSYVRITSDWTRATTVIAAQHRCDLILAGISERAFAGGLLRRGPLEELLENAPCDIGIYRPAP